MQELASGAADAPLEQLRAVVAVLRTAKSHFHACKASHESLQARLRDREQAETMEAVLQELTALHAKERVAQEDLSKVSIAWSQAQPYFGADSPESARLVPVVQQACADLARLFQESLMGSRLDVAFCSGVMATYTTLQDHGRSPVLKCVCHFL